MQFFASKQWPLRLFQRDNSSCARDFLDGFLRPLQWFSCVLSVYPMKAHFLSVTMGHMLGQVGSGQLMKCLDGSIGLQAHKPESLPHSCPFRLRAYHPRQAQKPTMDTTVITTRAKVFPTSVASTGRIRERKMSHTMAAALGSSSLGAMLSQVSRSWSQASESDDAKGSQTSWSAQPITAQLCSSLASRMFCFSCHVNASFPSSKILSLCTFKFEMI